MPRSTQKVEMAFENAPWGESHGFSKNTLGAAPLYATIASSLSVKDVLVIGSGAGFTPKVFLENVPSIANLHLVDAFLAETGNGSPLDITDQTSDYPSIVINRHKLSIFKVMSKPFLEQAIVKNNSYDLIFIDGDHSMSGFRSDLELSLLCLRAGGAILFHDTKITHIPEVANRLLENKWVNFEIGAGVGLFISDREGALMRENSELTQDEMKDLFETSMAQRWDYLASPEFRVRNETVNKMLGKHLNRFGELSALEIGGNPAPLLPEIRDLGIFTDLATVEPYISPSVEHIFEEMARSGVSISKSLDDITNKNSDLLIVLGVDLSLSEDFPNLRSDASKIQSLFWKAKIVVTESSNYQPSKWLEKFLTKGLTLIESQTIVIDANEKFSISKDIQTRTISIWEVPDEKLNELSDRDSLQSELIKYARWHAMEDTPKELLQFGDSGYDVQQTFNAWQVELDPMGKSFVWLKSKQRITFPTHSRELVIRFSQGPTPVLAHGLLFKSKVIDNEITIKRRTPFKRLKFDLKTWVPSTMDPESGDHRELTIAVHGFEFI